MRKELTDHHLPPLSTRMIFLHHRVRMHDQTRLNAPRADDTARALPLAAWAGLVALLLAAAMVFGVLHA